MRAGVVPILVASCAESNGRQLREQAARALGNVALHEVNEHLILRARGVQVTVRARARVRVRVNLIPRARCVQALVLLLRPGSAGHHPSPGSAAYHPSPGSAGDHPFNLIDAALGALGRQIESNPSPSLSPSPRSYPYPTRNPNAHQGSW